MTVVNPSQITAMTTASPGWQLRLRHSRDCSSPTRTVAVLAWAATAMHGVQPVCVDGTGTALGLLEDLCSDCSRHCRWHLTREAQE